MAQKAIGVSSSAGVNIILPIVALRSFIQDSAWIDTVQFEQNHFWI